MSILTVDSITMKFGGVTALDNVTFDVEEGSIHAVIGPNGSGKTTLYNVITGVYKPTSGKVVFDGQRIDKLRPYQIARQHLVRTFQHPRLFKTLTVLDQLKLALHSKGPGLIYSLDWKDRALEILDQVGLLHLANSPAQSLPQGQRRLLEIARAMCLQPKLLLLDEPHAGLNGAETEHLMKLISQLNREGLTILLVEHEMRIVMTLAHVVTVLNFGKLLAMDEPKLIQTNSEVVEAYLGVRKRVSINE